MGGAEHSIMHLLFARFIAQVLNHEKLVPSPEPFNHLLTQGMVLGETYVRRSNGAFLPASAVHKEGSQWKTADGEDVDLRYEKMSKSKHNGVDPVEVVKTFGSDAVRIGMLMQCPPENAFVYTSHIMNPAMHLLQKLDSMCAICLDSVQVNKHVKLNVKKLNTYYGKIQRDMENFSFHTVLSSINIMVNTLLEAPYSSQYLEYVKAVLCFIAPFAPIKAEECWNRLIAGHKIDPTETFTKQRWPEEKRKQNITAIIQVNGKTKTTFLLNDHMASITDPALLMAELEKEETVRKVLSFRPQDMKLIRKGQRVIVNYSK